MTIQRLAVHRGTAHRVAVRHTLPGLLAMVLLVSGFAHPVLAQEEERPVITPENAAQVVELAALHGHAPGGSTGVVDIAFTADGQTLYSAGSDQTIRKWEVSTGTLVDTLVLDDEPTALALSPDGKTLAFSTEAHTVASANLADWSQGQVLYEQDSYIYDLAYTPDGTRLISAGKNGAIWIWDAASGKTTAFVAHSDIIYKIAVSPDSHWLVSASADRAVGRWNLDDMSGGPMGLHDSSVDALATGSDGLVISTDGNRTRLWNVETGAQQGAFKGDYIVPTAAAISPDNRLAAVSVNYPGNLIQLWDVQTRTKLVDLQGHTEEIENVIFSPDGRLLASCSADDTIRLWGIQTSDEAGGGGGVSNFSQSLRANYTTAITIGNISKLTSLAAFRGYTMDVMAVAFSPDSLYVASGDQDNNVRVWDITTGQEKYMLAGHTDEVHGVAFSPDGTLLASASEDETVKLWNLATGTEERTLYGYSAPTDSVAFSPDGTLVAGGQDGGIYLWETSTGATVAVLNTQMDILNGYSVYDVAFSPDGTMLASALYGYSAAPPGALVLWDVATGEIITSVDHTDGVRSVAFSPDGKQLAIGTEDNLVILWDVATQTVIRTLTGHTNSVWTLDFSPDGSLLVSAGITQVIVWDPATGAPLAGPDGQFCAAFSDDGTLIATGGSVINPDNWYAVQLFGLPEE
jgi:WD40 repeat protein